ncbi:hypothetical protein ACIBTV_22520 [Micromonospora sp. NPDC049366]|uniref:hypothetical protein n=1 Tax=Micromonospora sp. NPDC049366 TaxID=3364271 RepID=UPI0037AC97B9
MDGSFYFTGGEAGEARIAWSNNVGTAAYSEVGPGFANFAGHLHLFWRERNAIQVMVRFPGQEWTNTAYEIPGSTRVGNSGRPAAAANGNYMMVAYLGNADASGYRPIWRHRYFGGTGSWEMPQVDANGWTTNRSVTLAAVSVVFEMLMIAHNRVIHEKVAWRT